MYVADKITSHFDTPTRSTFSEIEKEKIFVNKFTIVKNLLEALPNAALLLDGNRQIVAYNQAAKNILSPDDNGRIEGRRVGEAVNCIHAVEMPAGCGTSKFCEECGAGKCNKITRETLQSCTDECRITTKKNNIESPLDLRVHTSTIELDEQRFTFFTIEDIQDEKRRKVLERIFFHDVLNTATAVMGISEIINASESLDEVKEFKTMMYKSSEQLVKEILTQRDLVNAEQGTLPVNKELKSNNELLSLAFNIYKDHKLSSGKHYTCNFAKDDFFINTDAVLLTRCIGNLIKNALEATEVNGSVLLYSTKTVDKVQFNVKNDSVIPQNYQLQIFQRSFSTKASAGRGIGTYSVKLLAEQYLKGRVSFISNENTGTVFTIELPLN
ncbi:MAG TPA: HAMP domain-containing sensor histidine kinase [Ignavibacteriaceae bacterium]|nr:HAMP domain-containing sensor histidine kinase [Ignavibacteriaceae bacterium]